MNEDQLVILRVDSSMRQVGLSQPSLADETISKLHAGLPDAEIVLRDLKAGVGHVNSAWREASLETAGFSLIGRPCNFGSVRRAEGGG